MSAHVGCEDFFLLNACFAVAVLWSKGEGLCVYSEREVVVLLLCVFSVADNSECECSSFSDHTGPFPSPYKMATNLSLPIASGASWFDEASETVDNSASYVQ